MKHNTIALYKHFCERIENPKGVDSLERAMCLKMCTQGKERLEAHFKNSKKYRNDPDIQALLNPEGEVKEDKPKKGGKKNEESKG